MSEWVSLLNGIAVSFFGSVLSAAFCHEMNTRRKWGVFWVCLIGITLCQGIGYGIGDAAFMRRIYPLVVHLPLIVVLSLLTKGWLWPVISVFFAYLCCQLRRWVSLLAVTLVPGGVLRQEVAELIVTLPLLWLLLRIIAPVVRRVAHRSSRTQLQFGVIPAVYYVFDYATAVYTDLLVSGGPVVVEFMSFVCCTAYLVFLLYYTGQEQKSVQLQQAQKALGIQLSQSVREIHALRESQALARRYRHDLRHHLQYLSACLENGQEEQAKRYIAGICEEIEAQKVQRYCENELVNLILSAFAGRAEKDGIGLTVQGVLPAVITISDSDLCVLLSNALENALHACRPFAAAGRESTVDVRFYEREGRFFLQITNPCGEEIVFENGIPVSHRPDHGMGVQSICAIVRQYGGIYTFTVQEGTFILRLSL